MILSAVLSKPSKNCEEILGRPYIKVRLRKNPSLKAKSEFQAELFTEKQAFQKNMTSEEAEEFLKLHTGTAFRNCIVKTDSEEITTTVNRKGEIKVSRRPVKPTEKTADTSLNRKKNYLIQEGIPVPFLVELGVMTKDGKVIAQKYDKFRQINRFLEFINDIIPDVQKLNGLPYTKDNPLTIIDFGSGKSYLTFAVYYLLHDIKKIPVHITGLDLKADVIKSCSALAEKLGCTGLEFKTGDIAEYSEAKNPDIIITLHACDTATDFALDYAVKKNAKAILSVPCCQHEINLQLEKHRPAPESPFASIEKFGILRERLAALATDAIRAEILDQKGYSVQVMEFIDISHTPKNVLIRAVKRQSEACISDKNHRESQTRTESLLRELGCTQTFVRLDGNIPIVSNN